MSSKRTVLLLFGGKSSEHSISCATAAGIMSAIDRSKFNLVAVGITRDGRFVPAEVNPELWQLSGDKLPEVVFSGVEALLPRAGSRQLSSLDESGQISSLAEVDVVFPVLHGPFGEDGTIQGMLELIGLPYVGNGVFASAAGMDKEFSKALFLQAGIPALPHAVITRNQWLNEPEFALEAAGSVGTYPLFVKPARAGSSVGVTKVSAEQDLPQAITKAFEHDSKVTVEPGVVAREIECAVLSGRAESLTRVSTAGEIVVTGREFYDFEAKYLDQDSVQLAIPAKLSEEELEQLQELAIRAFEAIGGFGLARVDFFLTDKGFLINEINTMPGFTPFSMYPKLWQASGIDYPQLITELIELAFER